jgi:hypothetical protein
LSKWWSRGMCKNPIRWPQSTSSIRVVPFHHCHHHLPPGSLLYHGHDIHPWSNTCSFSPLPRPPPSWSPTSTVAMTSIYVAIHYRIFMRSSYWMFIIGYIWDPGNKQSKPCSSWKNAFWIMAWFMMMKLLLQIELSCILPKQPVS